MENQKEGPPKWADRFLEWYCRVDLLEEIQGDIHELFDQRTRQKGGKKARLHFIWDVFRSFRRTTIRSFISDTNGLLIQRDMFRNYLKVAVRNMWRNKSYFFLNLLGLVTGLVVFILMTIYVQHELTFDQHHEKKDRIYRVVREQQQNFDFGSNRSGLTRPNLGTHLQNDYPEIDAVAQFFNPNGVGRTDQLLISVGNENHTVGDIWGASAEVFQVFSFETLAGNPNKFLTQKAGVVLTRSIAQQFFGNEEPIGQVILYKGRFPFTVEGVIEDLPEKSHLNIEILFNYMALIEIEQGGLTNYHSYTYLLLKEEASMANLSKKLLKIKDTDINPRDNGQRQNRFYLQTLADVYLQSENDNVVGSSNNVRKLYLMLLIAFLILGVACINYTNLNTAKAFKRVKEVGIRKTVGASKGELIVQFLSESSLLTFIALVVSFGIIWTILPQVSAYLGAQLDFNPLEQTWLLPFLLGIVLFVGGISGAYPAILASSFQPLQIIKGNLFSGINKNHLKRILVVTQFAISGVLILAAIVVARQLKFIQSKDMGYARDQIIVMDIKDGAVGEKLPTFKEALAQIPGVEFTASSSNTPNDMNMSGDARWPGKPEDLKIRLSTAFVDYDFIDLYSVPLVEGRVFSRDFRNERQSVLINESAAKALGFENPLERELITWRGDTANIVGVIQDFHHQPLHSDITPLQLFFGDFSRTVSIKINGENIPEILKAIQATYSSFSPKYPFEYTFFDEVFHQSYQKDMKTAQMANWATLLTIIIACLGLYGLSSFTAEMRLKEISIRKILGASVFSILFLLSREFLLLTAIAFVIALPVGYYVMDLWLQSFAFRVSINFSSFALTLVGLFGITIATIGILTMRAATNNPVETLGVE